MDTIVKVLDNMTAIDLNGKDITKKVPAHARKRAAANGHALRMVTTKTGKTQWRDTAMADYEALRTQAVPVHEVNNVKNELEQDVVEFIKTCEALRPQNLIMNSLKWKYLMRSVLRGKNIMMTGPSGCGKTLAAQSVAKVLANEPVTVEISQSELNELRSRSEVEIMSVEKVQ